VESYISDVKYRIKCDVEKISELVVDPSKAPTEVVVKDAAGYKVGRPDRLGPGLEVVQDRNPFYKENRLQSTIFEIAAEITNRLSHDSKQFLFPQVLNVVWEYLEKRVIFIDAPPEEVALLKYMDMIVERISEAIEPDTEVGEQPILPVIEKFRSVGSTSEVLFRTRKHCFGTQKSHVSHIVADSPKWEHDAAYHLERSPEVISYVKNDHLDFTIPYEWGGVNPEYRPDFIIRARKKDGGEKKIIIEVKGFETEKDRQKETAAKKWVSAINHHGGFGEWGFAVCKDPKTVEKLIKKVCEV
jgi:type III restriction enzyme